MRACARHGLPEPCCLSTTHPLSGGFLPSIKSSSHLFPRSVSHVPRLRGSLAALQGTSFKGALFLKEKQSSVLVQKTTVFFLAFFFLSLIFRLQEVALFKICCFFPTESSGKVSGSRCRCAARALRDARGEKAS